jgi:hypothetical protein
MISVNLSMIVWMGFALLAVPLGIVEPERPSVIIRELLTRISLVLVPAIWIATKIIQRRHWAIWAGTAVALVMLLATIAAYYLGAPNDMGGLYNYRDPGMSFALATLTIMLAVAQFLSMVVGILAYRANRQSAAWSRQGSR